MNFFINKLKIIKNFNLLCGIVDGKLALCGPRRAMVDLTSFCNNSCLSCWIHSPLVKGKKKEPVPLNINLPFDVFKAIIEELFAMGTKEIVLSGPGEPFMYPEIMEAIEYIKGKNMFLLINTNLNIPDEEMLNRIVKLKVDALLVSIWAASPEIYKKIHPNQSENELNKIRDKLDYLNKIKRKNLTTYPNITIKNVLLKYNIGEFNEMINFALEVNADHVDFTIMDPMKETDSLMIDEREIKNLKLNLFRIKERTQSSDRNRISTLISSVELWTERLTSMEDAKEGKYDLQLVDSIPCYIGWLYTRIRVDGGVMPCSSCYDSKPLGNVFRDPFKVIWNSKEYQQFRLKSKEKKYGNPYFEKCYCWKTCCHYPENLQIHKRLKKISPVAIKMAFLWRKKFLHF